MEALGQAAAALTTVKYIVRIAWFAVLTPASLGKASFDLFSHKRSVMIKRYPNPTLDGLKYKP